MCVRVCACVCACAGGMQSSGGQILRFSKFGLAKIVQASSVSREDMIRLRKKTTKGVGVCVRTSAYTRVQPDADEEHQE